MKKKFSSKQSFFVIAAVESWDNKRDNDETKMTFFSL